MHILLNGEPREVTSDSTLADLLATLDLCNKRYAVEINEELIPRSQHTSHPLHADDRVEVVQAIGGG
ncbi:sulfur carrier protein ThiS [Thiosocius teredinicola]|uniref:sulfur carrier protein ThiS n=1 Tax=Thiosocius teredinicola TaxID=1973002 RepID=UPI0009914936